MKETSNTLQITVIVTPNGHRYNTLLDLLRRDHYVFEVKDYTPDKEEPNDNQSRIKALTEELEEMKRQMSGMTDER